MTSNRWQAAKHWIAYFLELKAGSERLLPMEGMRGLSALLVFFVHFHSLFGSHAEKTSVYELFSFLAIIGNCGVDVFFALSGFIIYGLLLKKPVSYLMFIRRRIVRLYPTFTAIFVLYVLLSLMEPAYSKLPSGLVPAVTYLFANFLMLPGLFPIIPMITPAWSLSYELCVYLTLPLVVDGLGMRHWPRSARISFWLFLCLAHLTLAGIGWLSHPRMAMFGCGILLRDVIRGTSKATLGGHIVALGAFATSLAIMGVRDTVVFEQFCGPIIARSGATLGGLFVATFALGYYALGTTGLLTRAFSWDWLRWFGNISYSYYLTHGLILHALKFVAAFLKLPVQLSSVAFVSLCLICFLCTVAGSLVIFLGVEKKLSFSARLNTTQATAAQSGKQPFNAVQ